MQLFDFVGQALNAIVTVDLHRSIPGTLKTALDHLFHEWAELPVVIITCGGRGGGKAGTHLREVCEGALHMRVVSQGELEVKIPKELIKGEERVSEEDKWLKAYEDKVDEVLERLLEVARAKEVEVREE